MKRWTVKFATKWEPIDFENQVVSGVVTCSFWPVDSENRAFLSAEPEEIGSFKIRVERNSIGLEGMKGGCITSLPERVIERIKGEGVAVWKATFDYEGGTFFWDDFYDHERKGGESIEVAFDIPVFEPMII